MKQGEAVAVIQSQEKVTSPAAVAEGLTAVRTNAQDIKSKFRRPRRSTTLKAPKDTP